MSYCCEYSFWKLGVLEPADSIIIDAVLGDRGIIPPVEYWSPYSCNALGAPALVFSITLVSAEGC